MKSTLKLKWILGTLLVLMSVHPAAALDGNAAALRAPLYRISSIEGNSEIISSQPIMMMLPRNDGFSPNLNIIIQNFDSGLSRYKALTDGQIRQAGLTVIASAIDQGVYTFEYSGTLSGSDMHVYARARQKNGRIFLTTATDLQAQWGKDKDNLINSVNSFTFVD